MIFKIAFGQHWKTGASDVTRTTWAKGATAVQRERELLELKCREVSGGTGT